MKWFDRKFAFDLDLWMYPNLIERLRGTPARTEEITHGLPQQIATKRWNNAWSIQENVGHLLDLELLWFGRVEDFFNGEEVLRPADLTNRLTHEAGHNDGSLDHILGDFRDARTRLVDRLDRADDAFRGAVSLHPRLRQPMRLMDLVVFVAEHDDHHLAQISKLVRQLETGHGTNGPETKSI